MNHNTSIIDRFPGTCRIAALLAATAFVAACGEADSNAADSSVAPDAGTAEVVNTVADQASTENAKLVQIAQYATPGGLQDIVIGSADAPVEIIEYASLTCSHCATFHTETYPELKEAYLDTGKAKLVFRHFVMNRYDMVATIIARCGGIEKAPGMVDLILSNQRRWINEEYMDHLTVMARRAGVGKEQIDRCMADQAEQQKIIDMRQHALDTYQVNATPTLIINGAKFEGSRDFDTLSQEIEKGL